MPFVAEFKTHGRSKMLDFGHAPDEDKDAIEKFEKQAIAMAKTRRRPAVPHNGRVVHSRIYGKRRYRRVLRRALKASRHGKRIAARRWDRDGHLIQRCKRRSLGPVSVPLGFPAFMARARPE